MAILLLKWLLPKTDVFSFKFYLYDISKAANVSLFVKKVFWGVLLSGNLMSSGKYNLSWKKELFCWKRMHTCKISCSVKTFSLSGILSCSGFQLRGETHKTLRKLSILIKIYLLSLDTEVFLYEICFRGR